MEPLRPLSTLQVPAPENTQYSNLEVDRNRWLENDSEAAPIVVQNPKDEKLISHTDEKIISYNDVGKQAVVADWEPSRPIEERKIFGLRRKTFFILLTVLLILIIASAVGGGVGRTIAARRKNQTATVPTTPTLLQAPTTTQVRYANTGLAAMQWTDLNGTLHNRLYYQDNSNKLRESAWDNSTTFDSAWKVNAISDAVKPGTPIAAAAGYPHASYNYSLVRIAYPWSPAIA
jgi:hypothetical protein